MTPAGMPGTGLLDRLHDWKDRLLSSPGFQRWATAFPLTRLIARRRAGALFDLCAGFVYSQVLLSCVRLRLFEMLAAGPQTAAQLALRLDLGPDATDRLLRAAVALKLLSRRRGGRYGLGPLGAPILGNPGIPAMVEHHAMLYADLGDPVALLRQRRTDTALGGYWPYGGTARPDALTPEQVSAYTALMSASQPLVAAEVLDAYPIGRHRCLMDVGGGDGTFLRAAAAHAPDISLMLFDLPAVVTRAAERFAEAGLSGRVRTTGGSFHHDDLPTGADLISLVRVLHDHDDADALGILRRAHAALPRGGTLLVAEPMAGAAGAAAMGDAYFGFYLLAMGRGRPRTADELTGLLHAAGFGQVRRIPTRTPMFTGLIIGRRDM